MGFIAISQSNGGWNNYIMMLLKLVSCLLTGCQIDQGYANTAAVPSAFKITNNKTADLKNV